MTSLIKKTQHALQSLPRFNNRASAPRAHAGTDVNDAFDDANLPRPTAQQEAHLAARMGVAQAPVLDTQKPLPPTPGTGLHRTNAIYIPSPKPQRPDAVKRKPLRLQTDATTQSLQQVSAAPSPATIVAGMASIGASRPPAVKAPPPSPVEASPIDASPVEASPVANDMPRRSRESDRATWMRMANDIASDCNIGDDEQPTFEAVLAPMFATTAYKPRQLGIAVQMVFPGFDTPTEDSKLWASLPEGLGSAVKFARRLNPQLPHFDSVERLRFFGALSELPKLAQARVFYLVHHAAPTLFPAAMADLEAARELSSREIAARMAQRPRMSIADRVTLANLGGNEHAAFVAQHVRDNPPLRRAVGRSSVLAKYGASAFKKGVSSANWDLQTPSD